MIDPPAEELDAHAEVFRAALEVTVESHLVQRALARHEQGGAEPVGLGLFAVVPVAAAAGAERGFRLVLEQDVRELVRQRVRAPALRLPRVVDDQPSCAGANRRRGESGVVRDQSADAFVFGPVPAKLAQGDDFDAEVVGEGETIERLPELDAELGTNGLGDPLGIGFEAAPQFIRHRQDSLTSRLYAAWKMSSSASASSALMLRDERRYDETMAKGSGSCSAPALLRAHERFRGHLEPPQ